jgi:UrcA family protein
MNTVNTPNTAIKTLLLSLITVGLFAGTAAIADQVGPSTLTKKVRFDDLNLSTVQGQQIAQDRVAQMARTLCSEVADPTDMSHHANYLACVDATVAKAGARLQALISRQSTTTLARADVK